MLQTMEGIDVFLTQPHDSGIRKGNKGEGVGTRTTKVSRTYSCIKVFHLTQNYVACVFSIPVFSIPKQ